MLSLKKIQKKKHAGGFSYLVDGDEVVCEHESWLMRCCGVNGLSSMNTNTAWWTHENIDRLCEFLLEVEDCYESSYNPEEYYIALSTGQLGMFPTLLADPRVTRVDKFKNKSHGPRSICLYRLSLKKDFHK